MGIVFALKERQGIIGVPEQGAVAPTVLGHRRDKPLVQDVIQEGIGDNRRDDRALRAAEFVIDDPTRRLDTRFEHPGNQTQKPLVGNPFRQDGEDFVKSKNWNTPIHRRLYAPHPTKESGYQRMSTR